MARKQRPAVQRYHDRVAGRYDDSYDDAYWAWHDGLTWDHLKPHLPADLRAPIADLGCGTGKWALKIAQSGYSVACVDISAKMLEQARQQLNPQMPQMGTDARDDEPRIARMNADELEAGQRAARFSFVQADLCDLSKLPPRHFALAVALGEPIGSTASPPRALKQIRRILRVDGKLVATFDNALNALDYYLETAGTDDVEKFLRSGVTHWLTRDRNEQFEIHTYSPAKLVKLLEACGFEVIDLIGKTVLPMRKHRALLEEPVARRRWAAIEKSLWRDLAAIGRAAHLQVVARVKA